MDFDPKLDLHFVRMLFDFDANSIKYEKVIVDRLTKLHYSDNVSN